MTVQTKVISIETNHFPDEKFKMTLTCASETGTDRICIKWGFGIPPQVYVGDTVILTGKIKNNVFLIYKMRILKTRQNYEGEDGGD